MYVKILAFLAYLSALEQNVDQISSIFTRFGA